MLITVQNNRVGISTDYGSQHGEKFVSDRGRAFGIRTSVVNGNDAIETYLALQAEMAYIRKTGKPVVMEFMVSRLYGHSSATGANREKGEDCIESLERKMIDAGMITIPPQDFETDERRALCESLTFSPWHGLAEHRPLGGINRLRRPVYDASGRHRLGAKWMGGCPMSGIS